MPRELTNPFHPLLEWAERKEMGPPEFVRWASERWDVTQEHVRHILARRRRPSHELTEKILNDTDVSYADLMHPTDVESENGASSA